MDNTSDINAFNLHAWTRPRKGTIAALKKIAGALKVPLDLIA
jgi:hypothetical protein